VMIESMAISKTVIGIIADALELDWRSCRKYVENKFSVSQIINGYEAVYK
jgi:hypothetical protein